MARFVAFMPHADRSSKPSLVFPQVLLALNSPPEMQVIDPNLYETLSRVDLSLVRDKSNKGKALAI